MAVWTAVTQGSGGGSRPSRAGVATLVGLTEGKASLIARTHEGIPVSAQGSTTGAAHEDQRREHQQSDQQQSEHRSCEHQQTRHDDPQGEHPALPAGAGR